MKNWFNKNYPEYCKALEVNDSFNEFSVKSIIKRYVYFYESVPEGDILSEIKVGMILGASLNLSFKDLLGLCRRRVCHLYTQYGIHYPNRFQFNDVPLEFFTHEDTGKMYKDFSLKHFSSNPEIIDDPEDPKMILLEKILDDYDRGLTVRALCEKYGVKYTPKIQKRFNRLFPRNEKKSSRCRGVSKSGSKYKAQIYKNGKKLFLGYFLTEEEASLAYKKSKIKE